MSATVRARAYLAFLAIAAFAIPREVAAQATGTIEGTVTDAGSKRPIANVQVTIVGSGGRTGALTNTATKKLAVMTQDLEDAFLLLDNDAMTNDDDPVLRTYRGEALAALGKNDEAREALEALAKDDLIVAPEGWAVLAKLRTDAKLAQAATARCASPSSRISCSAGCPPTQSRTSISASRPRVSTRSTPAPWPMSSAAPAPRRAGLP